MVKNKPMDHLKHYPRQPKYHSINDGNLVVCGSSRFLNEMQDYAQKAAKIMQTPLYQVTVPSEKARNIKHKAKLIHQHMTAISKWCSVIVIYNGKEDYIGINTAMEIGYAYMAGKTMFTSHPTKIPELLALELKVA